MAPLPLFATESAALLSLRFTLGDEGAAELLFSDEVPHNPDFVKRHSNQLSSLIDAKFKP